MNDTGCHLFEIRDFLCISIDYVNNSWLLESLDKCRLKEENYTNFAVLTDLQPGFDFDDNIKKYIENPKEGLIFSLETNLTIDQLSINL